MAKARSHVKGAKRLTRKLRRFDPEITEALRDELEWAIRQVQKTAVRNAPVRSGKAKRLLASPSAVGKKQKGLSWEFGLRTKRLARELFYIRFYEYGTKGGVIKSGPFAGRVIPPQPARPFLFEALQRNRTQIRERRKRAVDRVLKRIASANS